MAVDVIARSIASGRVPITAYDMAVAGGYTGTKEQFEADMGNSGTNATNAANSAAAAEAAAETAISISDDLAQYKTDTMVAPMNIVKGQYILAAGDLYRAIVNISPGTTLVVNSNVVPVTVGEELTRVISSDERKADIDGSYEGMTVGNADQLVSKVGVEDQVPYSFRTSGGGADIGVRETDMVVGGTVAWNQLMPEVSSNNYSNHNGTVSFDDGVATIVPNAKYGRMELKTVKLPYVCKGHKYLLSVDCKKNFNLEASAINVKPGKSLLIKMNASDVDVWKTYTVVYESASTGIANYMYFGDVSSKYDAELNQTINVKNIQLIDLTQMFGTTIADYITSLERSSTGDGVAWFRKLFPKYFYAYDAGSLQSVETYEHKMVGFNAFNKNASDVVDNYYLDANGTPQYRPTWKITGYIPVIGGQTYYLAAATSASYASDEYMVWYDSSKNIITAQMCPGTSTYDSGHIRTAPENAAYARVSVSDSSLDTFIFNLSWDGERNGEYEPYVEHTYHLDGSLTLRGLPKLDANSKLYYDGDTYASDGTVTRKYGIVDLGTLNWTRVTTSSYPYFRASLQYHISRSTTAATQICSKYTAIPAMAGGSFGQSDYNGCICAEVSPTYPYSERIFVQDAAYTDAVAFKTAMSGVYLVYKRASFTTEQTNMYTNPQIVDDTGTEEYLDWGVRAGERDVSIPVGHQTFYQANLKAKLESSPDSPDGDGDYILRQTNGENVYVPLVIPNELPDAPGEDGTYILQAAVSGGVPTYSWVVQN